MHSTIIQSRINYKFKSITLYTLIFPVFVLLGYRKLFNKMILQSATSLMEWVYQIDPEMKARKLAKELGCTSNDDNAILDHLKQTPALDLIRKQLKTLSPYEIAQHVPMPFRPVVNPNDDIMPVAPIELLSKQDYLNIPVMMGYNSDEGIVMLKLYMSKVEHFEKSIKYSYPRYIYLVHQTCNIV